MKTINNDLLDARFDAGLTLRDVSRLLGTRRAERFGMYERGKTLPTLEHALMLEILYQRPVAALFTELYATLKARVYANRSRERARRIAKGGGR